jgi:hypothetical protein
VNSGAIRTTDSDGNGHFGFVGLSIGTYTLSAEKEGFSTGEIPAFLLSVGQVAIQNIALRVAGVAGKIDVKESANAVETAATTSSVAFGYDRIEEVPTRSRNYLNFVKLAPGVAASSGSTNQKTVTGIRNPLADSGFSFGGLRGRNNAINIDGVDNRDEVSGGNRVAIGLEMIQEFRVVGVAVGAELGGASGGMINVVTKSGSNVWHGDVDFFVQNELFNARKPEAETTLTPRFRRYQPGVSTNGPIRKNRTFVSAAFEYERESGQEWSEVSQNAAVVINRALLSPKYSGTPVRSVLRGFFDTQGKGVEFSTKLDHQLSSKNTLALRYGFSRGRESGDVQGTDNYQDRSGGGNSLTTDHSLVANWTSVISPTTVNEFRAQFAERGQEFRPNALGPMIEIPGVLTFGQGYRLNADRTERHYEAIENLNFVTGSHRISVGADLHTVTLDARFANRFGGIFIFPTLADFVRGTPDVFIQAFGQPKTTLTTVPIGLWFQDRWQVKPGVLLEAGVRYDRQRMPNGLPSSSNGVSPRLGLAWTPSKRNPMVVRAGFGLFYDRYPLAFLNDAVQKNGVNAFEQYAVGDVAIQALMISQGGTLANLLPGVAPSIYRASSRFPSTYSRKLSVGLEQGFGKNTTLTVEANEVRGFNLPRTRNLNGTIPPLYQLEQTARSEFRGGSISLHRRMSNEFAFLVAYNVGTARDDGSDFDEQPLNPFNIRQDWARSRQYQLHRLVASSLFEIPGEELTSAPAWLREGLEGISVGPVFTFGTGRPINALLTTDAYRTGAYPISARPLDIGRNPYLSPSTIQMDLRVVKSVPILHERAKLQFGVESFNLLNHTNPLRVSQFFSANGARLGSYGQMIESQNARQVQFLMNVEY